MAFDCGCCALVPRQANVTIIAMHHAPRRIPSVNLILAAFFFAAT
jgi:hypothetical protein